MLNSRTCAAVVTLCLALGANAVAQQKSGAVKPLTTQDYIDIQQLLHKYAFAIDNCTNNGYDYADLYTPDGIFYWGQNSPRKSVGREQLAEAAGGGKNGCKKLQTATKEKPLQVHVTVNEVIEASPEGAIGKNYLTYPGIMGIRGDDSHTGYVGGYQDVYVKTAQGWRIKKRVHIMPPMIPGTFVFPDEPTSTK